MEERDVDTKRLAILARVTGRRPLNSNAIAPPHSACLFDRQEIDFLMPRIGIKKPFPTSKPSYERPCVTAIAVDGRNACSKFCSETSSGPISEGSFTVPDHCVSVSDGTTVQVPRSWRRSSSH